MHDLEVNNHHTIAQKNAPDLKCRRCISSKDWQFNLLVAVETVILSCDIILIVNKRGRVLAAIFQKQASIAWTDIEALLLHRAEISEGRGSRVRVALNGVRAVFHRPHPKKETDRGAVASMLRFLVEAGVTPKGEGK